MQGSPLSLAEGSASTLTGKLSGHEGLGNSEPAFKLVPLLLAGLTATVLGPVSNKLRECIRHPAHLLFVFHAQVPRVVRPLPTVRRESNFFFAKAQDRGSMQQLTGKDFPRRSPANLEPSMPLTGVVLPPSDGGKVFRR